MSRRVVHAVVPVVRAVVLAGCGVVLAGCAGLPAPSPPPPRPAPVVTTAQAQRIVAATRDVLTQSASGSQWNPDLAATRLTGPALEWASAAAAGGRAVQVPPAPDSGAVVIAPQAGEWPRAFATADSGQPGLLAVYVGESARLPYRLWAAIPLVEPLPPFGPPDAALAVPLPAVPLPAVPLPAMPGPAEPGSAVDTTAGGAADVVADLPDRYVDVLREGDRSVHAPEFEADGYAAALRQQLEAERTRLGPQSRVTVTHEVLGGVVLAALAANGDALVVASFGTTLTPVADPATTADPAAAGTATRWIAALAFVVPAAEGNIRVVGAADDIALPPDQASMEKE